MWWFMVKVFDLEVNIAPPTCLIEIRNSWSLCPISGVGMFWPPYWFKFHCEVLSEVFQMWEQTKKLELESLGPLNPNAEATNSVTTISFSNLIFAIKLLIFKLKLTMMNSMMRWCVENPFNRSQITYYLWLFKSAYKFSSYFVIWWIWLLPCESRIGKSN